jgi:hypothetical protein
VILSVAQDILDGMIEWLVNDELEMTWKEAIEK